MHTKLNQFIASLQGKTLRLYPSKKYGSDFPSVRLEQKLKQDEQSDDKASLFLHSKIDPLREELRFSEQQNNNLKQNQFTEIIGLGMGLGYGWAKLDLPDSITRVTLFCLNLEFLIGQQQLLYKIFSQVDFSDSFSSKLQKSEIVFEYLEKKEQTLDDIEAKNLNEKTEDSESKYSPQCKISSLCIKRITTEHQNERVIHIYDLNSLDAWLTIKREELRKQAVAAGQSFREQVQQFCDHTFFHIFPPLQAIFTEKINKQEICLHLATSRNDKDNKDQTKAHFAFLWQKNFMDTLRQKSRNNQELKYLHSIYPYSKRKDIDESRQIKDKETIGKKFFIAGAAYSLEKFFEKKPPLDLMSKELIILSTDSAEGVLRYFGLEPDFVFSADGSAFNQNLRAHFPRQKNAWPLRFAPLLIQHDLFAANDYIALTGTHPLEQLLQEYFQLANLGISGSHVGEMAVKFALAMQAQAIFIAGMDLSYVDAISYSGNTPYSDFFQRKSSRLSPFSHQVFQQVQRTRAYKSGKIYRRKSLDDAIQKFNRDYGNRGNIYFIDFPNSLQKELGGKHLSSEKFISELKKNHDENSKNFPSVASKREYLRKKIHIESLETSELQDFLQRLPQWLGENHIRQSLYGHWRSQEDYNQQYNRQSNLQRSDLKIKIYGKSK